MAFFTQASYDRAKMLAEQSGLTDEALILIDLSYGEITEDEANHRLNELREREGDGSASHCADRADRAGHNKFASW